MIVTFTSLIQGRSISMKSTKLASGTAFDNPGSFGGSHPRNRHPPLNWRATGATSGASVDNRGLPEWVEFEWSEPVHPEDPKQTLEEYRALPRKTQRVQVRERIPLDVVQEVIESRRSAPRGKLPSKVLWVYFVWTEQGVKFHWELKDWDTPQLLRSGGDDIDSM